MCSSDLDRPARVEVSEAGEVTRETSNVVPQFGGAHFGDVSGGRAANQENNNPEHCSPALLGARGGVRSFERFQLVLRQYECGGRHGDFSEGALPRQLPSR